MASKALEKLRRVSLNTTVDTFQPDLFDKFRSLLVILLNETKKASSFHFKECDILFSQLLPLYIRCPAETLKFSISVIKELFKTRLGCLLKDNSNSTEEILRWEEVIRMILNGIQDYIENNKADLSSIGRELYKPLLDIFASPLGLKLGARVRTQAFGLLSDAAEKNKTNKELLKQPSVLGGIRLGHLIAATNEYLALDCLFQLLARLTPSCHETNARSALASEVFQNPRVLRKFGAAHCKDLSKILQNSTGDKWEQATDEMICILAKADPSKPQPFLLAINEIHANSISMHPPESLNKVYLDKTEILVNLRDEDGIDCLQATYMSITSIQFNVNIEQGQDFVQIIINLSLPPIKSDDPIPPGSNGNSLSFILARSELSPFKVALGTRGLDSKISDIKQLYRNKRSVVSGPLNLNDVGATSFEIKSKELENLCATTPMNVKFYNNGFQIAALDETPERKPLNDTSKVKSSEPALRHCENARIYAPVSLKLSDLLLGLEEPSNDFDSPPSVEPVMTSKMFSQKLQKSFLLDEEELLTSKRPDSQSQNLFPNISEDLNGLHKGEHKGGSGSPNTDEGVKEPKLKSKPTYNSQLLKSPEAAVKRATHKYKTRLKRLSPPPIGPVNDNFDSIPNVSLTNDANTHTKEPSVTPAKPQPRKRGRKPFAIKNNKVTKRTGKTEAKKALEMIDESESIAIRRSKRSKQAKVVALDEEYPLTDRISAKEAEMKESSPAIFKIESSNAVEPLEMIGEAPACNFRPCNNSGDNPLVISCPTSSENQCKVVKIPNTHDENITSSSKAKILSSNSEIFDQPPSTNAAKDQMDQFRAPVTVIDSIETDVGTENSAMDIDSHDLFAPAQVDTNTSAPAICSSATFVDPTESGTSEYGISQPIQLVTQQFTHPGTKDISIEFRIPSRHTSPISDAYHANTFLRRDTLYVENTEVTQNCKEKPCEEKSGSEIQDATVHPEVAVANSITPNSILKENRPEGSSRKAKACLSVSFAKGTKDSPTSARPSWTSRLGKCDIPSRIPRLSSTCATSSKSYGSKAPSRTFQLGKYDSSEASRVPCRATRLKEAPPQFPDSSDESASDKESTKKLSTDDQIAIALNQIHEVILSNLHRKFDIASFQTQRISQELKMLAAEDIQEMLVASAQHRQNMVQTEKKYAEFGRALRDGFEDLVSVNEGIEIRLKQAIVDHDKNSIVKMMPKKLADRPKIMQRLMADMK